MKLEYGEEGLELGRVLLSNSDFISIGSISKYCMVSPSTVRRWIISGKLLATRLPSGHFRVTTSDLRVFLRKYNIPIPKDLAA